MIPCDKGWSRAPVRFTEFCFKAILSFLHYPSYPHCQQYRLPGLFSKRFNFWTCRQLYLIYPDPRRHTLPGAGRVEHQRRQAPQVRHHTQQRRRCCHLRHHCPQCYHQHLWCSAKWYQLMDVYCTAVVKKVFFCPILWGQCHSLPFCLFTSDLTNSDQKQEPKNYDCEKSRLVQLYGINRKKSNYSWNIFGWMTSLNLNLTSYNHISSLVIDWQYDESTDKALDYGWAMNNVRCIVCTMFWNFWKHLVLGQPFSRL